MEPRAGLRLTPTDVRGQVQQQLIFDLFVNTPIIGSLFQLLVSRETAGRSKGGSRQSCRFILRAPNVAIVIDTLFIDFWGLHC